MTYLTLTLILILALTTSMISIHYIKRKRSKDKAKAMQQQLNILNSLIGKEAIYESTLHINTSQGCLRSTEKHLILITRFDNRFIYYTYEDNEESFQRIDWFLAGIRDGSIQIIKGKV